MILTVSDFKESTEDDFQSAALNKRATGDECSGSEAPKRRRSGSARRNVTKSEPGSHGHHTHDGSQDSDVTVVSSGEGHTLLPVSAMVCYKLDPHRVPL